MWRYNRFIFDPDKIALVLDLELSFKGSDLVFDVELNPNMLTS